MIGHLAALLTIFVWGTTYISTKVLLESFSPIEILFSRFLIGFLALSIALHTRIRFRPAAEERIYAAAGLCGVTMYFLFENIALEYTYASNASVIAVVIPMLTAILARIFLHGAPIRFPFIAGFLCAMTGIVMLSFAGASELRLNPFGDFLAFVAACVWAVYSIFTRRIAAFGESSLAATRHIFFYGLLFMLPALYIFDYHWKPDALTDALNLSNLLFLGLGASALCFVTWTFSVMRLGAVKAAVYLYLQPVVTILFAVAVLGERITPLSAAGIFLTMAGLFLSEWLPALMEKYHGK